MLSRPTKKIELKELTVELYEYFNAKDKIIWLKKMTEKVDLSDKETRKINQADMIDANLLVLPRMVAAIYDKEGKPVTVPFEEKADYILENSTDGDKILGMVGDMAMEIISPNVKAGSLQSSNTQEPGPASPPTA